MTINNSNGNHHYYPNDFSCSNQTYNESYGNGNVSNHPYSRSDSEFLNQNLVNPVVSPAANNTAITSDQETDDMAFWRRFRGSKELGLNFTIDNQLLDLVNPCPPKVTSSNSSFSLKAMSLQIGTWEKIIIDGSESIKCKGFPKESYFTWDLDELIDNKRLKKRIKFNWSDIEYMKVDITFDKNDLGYLAFKLKNKPKLFVENDSPAHDSHHRRHTVWKKAPYDFTDNQASSSGSMLVLKFKPEILEKYYHYVMKANPDPNYYRPLFSFQDVSARLRDIVNYLRCDDTQVQTPCEDNDTNNEYNQNDEMQYLNAVPDVSRGIDYDSTQQLPSSSMNEVSYSGVQLLWGTNDHQNDEMSHLIGVPDVSRGIDYDSTQQLPSSFMNEASYSGVQRSWGTNDHQNDEMHHLIAGPDVSRMIDYNSFQQLPSSSMNEASSSGVQRSWGTNDFFSNGSLGDIKRRYF